ncbi:hypothetical protein O3P69_014748 [Scylla paramamosain]|uniref:Pro-resilin n=1 Tax=Scylla paramamosain TaxID=85552 RepID=A0AAW0U0W4_SCYPA
MRPDGGRGKDGSEESQHLVLNITERTRGPLPAGPRSFLQSIRAPATPAPPHSPPRHAAMHAQIALLVTLVAAALARPERSYDGPASPSPLFGARARAATASLSSSAPLSPSSSNTASSRGFRPSRPSSSSSSQNAGYSYNSPSDAGYSYSEPRQTPAQYDTQYVVSDAEFGTNFGQQERRDGDDVSGTYYVQLPDGRLQVVTYTVSAETGYVAEVTYEGQTTTAAPTYAAPASTYGQPSSGYGVPSSDYGVPSSG